MNRRELERFNRFWEKLYQKVPEARAQAVEAMGEAVRKELRRQVFSADFTSGAHGSVDSWQSLRFGSRGGYAAISPQSGVPRVRDGKQSAWRARLVTTRMVTGWLERGHGARRSVSGKAGRRIKSAALNARTGSLYVKGRQFYSAAKQNAWDEAKKAADRVLSKIADEVDD